VGEYAKSGDALDARGMRIAIVAGRFNDHVTKPLLEGALSTLGECGADADSVPVHWVPGAFEVPLVAKRLAGSGTVDAVVCLGAVIRGDTAHFDYVAATAIEMVTLLRSLPRVDGRDGSETGP
jgi:6,7-dimethyl-8-ribityllumazine synthase